MDWITKNKGVTGGLAFIFGLAASVSTKVPELTPFSDAFIYLATFFGGTSTVKRTLIKE